MRRGASSTESRAGANGPAAPPIALETPGDVPDLAIEEGAPRSPATAAARDPTYRVDPRWTLIALGLSLVGFVGVAAQLYSLKFVGSGPTLLGFPSRVLFVFGMALVVAPLILSVFRRPVVLFVLPSIALVFLLYPLFVPYGIPSGQDPIYNFQFAQSLLQTGHWTAGSGVTNQAVAYSYYPGSAVFNAELANFTGVPLDQTFPWGIPLLRLLILPATIYGLAMRYFGARIAFGAVLIFLAAPSILFNTPVQSEFAIPFFALTLTLVGYLLVDGQNRQNSLAVSAALFAGLVVISHTLTAYALAAWLGGLLVLWTLFRSSSAPQTGRAGAVLGIYLAFLFLFTYAVSRPEFLANYASLTTVLASLLNPASLSRSSATSLGASFPLYQLVWSYLAFLVLLLGSLRVLRRWFRTHRRSFATPNLIMAILAVVVALPLLVTPYNFRAERIMEYGEVFMAPALAWGIVRWTRRGLAGPAPAPLVPRREGAPIAWQRYGAVVGAIALVVLVFTGGSLVPFSTRDQFAAPSAISVESPLHIDAHSYALAQWAQSHLTASTYVWGDFLTYSVFGGFGHFDMLYNQYSIFNGTTLPASVWATVPLGSYVVVDKYMTTSTPQFPGDLQPTGPLTAGQLEKYNDPAFFDRVYQDSTFTIYQVVAVP